jgi:hypothetical protein
MTDDDRARILAEWARAEQRIEAPPAERMTSFAKALKLQADLIEAAARRLPFESEPASFLLALEALKATR